MDIKAVTGATAVLSGTVIYFFRDNKRLHAASTTYFFFDRRKSKQKENDFAGSGLPDSKFRRLPRRILYFWFPISRLPVTRQTERLLRVHFLPLPHLRITLVLAPNNGARTIFLLKTLVLKFLYGSMHPKDTSSLRSPRSHRPVPPRPTNTTLTVPASTR